VARLGVATGPFVGLVIAVLAFPGSGC
jgi:hypothetical protein